MSLDSANPNPVVDNIERFLASSSEVGFASILEYAGLCIEGRVRDASVEGSRRYYDVVAHQSPVAESASVEISFATKDYGSKIPEEIDLREMQCLMLGLGRLNATVKAEGKWRHEFPDQKFISKIDESDLLRNLSQPMHSDSFLTIEDLDEINAWFLRLQIDESNATSDPVFSVAFPSNFRDCLRHRSGHEVLLYRNDSGDLVSHRIDAPNPADDLYTKWCERSKQKPTSSKGNKSLRWKRWRLAKILGSIPDARKPEVFNWVSDALWKMEEYESTHGRLPLPRAFEYFFDDYVLFTNEQMEFELIKM